MTSQKPKQILLIAPSFFGYSKEIRNILEKRGYLVWQYEDRPSTSTVTKALIRIAPWLLRAKAEKYFDNIAQKLEGQDISHVLVIKGEALSTRSISRLKLTFKEARFILYFWDSYKNMPRDSKQKVTLFDKAFTFDLQDAELDNRLTYRPLFYLDEYRGLPNTFWNIDILFIGTAHSDRYAVLEKISKLIPAKFTFVKVLYLPSRWIYFLRKFFDPSFWRSRSSEFVFLPVKKVEMLELISRSRIIIDIERSIQSGLTMRTIEMLGAGKKIITTNPSVLSADFYNPINIAVIDRNNPVIDEYFLMSDYISPPASVVEKYCLSSWIDEVIYVAE